MILTWLFDMTTILGGMQHGHMGAEQITVKATLKPPKENATMIFLAIELHLVSETKLGPS